MITNLPQHPTNISNRPENLTLSALILEQGGYLLLESSSHLVLEGASAAGNYITNLPKNP